MGPNSLQRLDGVTGQATASYTFANPPGTPLATHSASVVHTDGTIFTLDGDTVVGIDPTTGAQKFSVALDHTTSDFTLVPNGDTCYSSPVRRSGPNRQADMTTHFEYPPTVGNLMIAGDGYAYATYYYDITTNVQYGPCGNNQAHRERHFRVCREWGARATPAKWRCRTGRRIRRTAFRSLRRRSSSQSGAIPNVAMADLITNADQGAVASWEAATPAYCAERIDGGTSTGCVSAQTDFKLTTLAGTSATTVVVNVPGGVPWAMISNADH